MPEVIQLMETTVSTTRGKYRFGLSNVFHDDDGTLRGTISRLADDMPDTPSDDVRLAAGETWAWEHLKIRVVTLHLGAHDHGHMTLEIRNDWCPHCGDALSGQGAYICVQRAGDEHDFLYRHCTHCDTHSERHCHDHFLRDSIETHWRSLGAEEHQRIQEAIARCPEPRNKHCQCPTHHDFFRGD